MMNNSNRTFKKYFKVDYAITNQYDGTHTHTSWYSDPLEAMERLSYMSLNPSYKILKISEKVVWDD